MKLTRLLGVAAALLLVSCQGIRVAAPTITIDVAEVQIASVGGSEGVPITVTDADKVEAKVWADNQYKTECDWVTAEYHMPKITLKASKNETGKDRAGFLKVEVSNSSGKSSATVRVVQAGDGDLAVEFAVHKLEFPAEGGSQEVHFTCTGNYLYYSGYEDDMDTEADWIDCSDGSTEYDVTIIVEPNYGAERVGFFVFFVTNEDWDENENADFEYDYVTITQAGSGGGQTGENEEPVGEPVAAKWVKVADSDDLESGWCLIVCESKSIAFDGSLASGNIDGLVNYKTVSVSANSIDVDATLAKSAFWYSAGDGSFWSQKDYFIGWDGEKNGVKAFDEPFSTNVAINGGNLEVVTSDGHHLRSNASEKRFRFFRSSSYASQSTIQLYRMPDDAGKVEFSVNKVVLTAGPRATSASFSISADSAVDWTASSSNPNFTLSQDSGSGSATMVISFSANTVTEPRSTTITVATESPKVETSSWAITFTQGPASEGDIDDGTPGYDDHLAPKRKHVRL